MVGLVERRVAVLTPSGNRASIVTFAVTDMAAARKAFDAAKIQVTVRNGGVRVAPALYNNAAEIDRFLEVAARLT